MPGSPSNGISLKKSDREHDRVAALLAEPLPLGDGVDVLASLIPNVLRPEGDTVTWLDAPPPRLSVAPADVPGLVSLLLPRIHEGITFPYLTEGTHWGSELYRILSSTPRPAKPTLSLDP